MVQIFFKGTQVQVSNIFDVMPFILTFLPPPQPLYCGE